jgi:sporulation protein YlmC with PRC-barrel domain
MVRFISDIIGSQVLLFQERAHVGPAKEVIIDPNDGSFLGIVVFDPIERKKKVVPASEIKGSGKNFLLIKDYDSISEPEDVIKIQSALEINPKIIDARVETQSGQYLGKVGDATVNFKMMCLEKLYVHPNSLRFKNIGSSSRTNGGLSGKQKRQFPRFQFPNKGDKIWPHMAINLGLTILASGGKLIHVTLGGRRRLMALILLWAVAFAFAYRVITQS